MGQTQSILAALAGVSRGARQSTEIDVAERIRQATAADAEARTLRELSAKDAIGDENALQAFRQANPQASGATFEEVLRSVAGLEQAATKKADVRSEEDRVENLRRFEVGTEFREQDVEGRKVDQRMRAGEIAARLVGMKVSPTLALKYANALTAGGEREPGELEEEDSLADILGTISTSIQAEESLDLAVEAVSLGVRNAEDWEKIHPGIPMPVELESLVAIIDERKFEEEQSGFDYSAVESLKRLRLAGKIYDMESVRGFLGREPTAKEQQDIFSITPSVSENYGGFTIAQLRGFMNDADNAFTDVVIPEMYLEGPAALDDRQQVEFRGRTIALRADPDAFRATGEGKGGVWVNDRYTDARIVELQHPDATVELLTELLADVEKHPASYWLLGTDTVRYTRAINDRLAQLQR